jgi:type II secretory pathway predicted ATPase ExeA
MIIVKDQAYEYFQHQLDSVKVSRKIFFDNAMETIIIASKGIPRIINNIALKSMYHAVVDKKLSAVDQESVMDVLEELGLK